MNTIYLFHRVITLLLFATEIKSRSLPYHIGSHKSEEEVTGATLQAKSYASTKLYFATSKTPKIDAKEPHTLSTEKTKKGTTLNNTESFNRERTLTKVEEISFKIGARGLSIGSNRETPNPFAVLSGSVNGRTETIENNKNPDWSDKFSLLYNQDLNQNIGVEIRHNEHWWPDTANAFLIHEMLTHIGFANIPVTKMMDSCTTYFNISNQGMYLIVERLTACEAPSTPPGVTYPTPSWYIQTATTDVPSTGGGDGRAWWVYVLYVLGGIAGLLIFCCCVAALGAKNAVNCCECLGNLCSD